MIALDSHTNRRDEARGHIDQALVDYFASEEPKSTSETLLSDELSVILSDLEDIIDCLLSLIPSIRNEAAPRFTLGDVLIHSEPNGQIEQLVRTQFPTIDPIIADRLVMAISWRWNHLASLRGLPSQTSGSDRSK